MSNDMRYDFAIQEPALAIAPVFLVLMKKKAESRAKLDVTRTFDGASIQWRGPDALGIPEQSVLLGLLSIAAQQKFVLDPNKCSKVGTKLLSLMTSGGCAILSELAVLKVQWRKIEIASGSKSHGGQNLKNVKMAVKRLAETTVWENRNGIEYEYRLLAWLRGDNDGVVIALNPRATDAMCGGQFVKISLEERNLLPEESAKALHAFLSGHMRPGSTRCYKVSGLQSHIWRGEATGSTSRSRDRKLRLALTALGQLPLWDCVLSKNGQVEIQRLVAGTFDEK